MIMSLGWWRKTSILENACWMKYLGRGLIVSANLKCLEKNDKYIEVKQIWQNIN